MRILHLEDFAFDAELAERIIHQAIPGCTLTRVSSRETFEESVRQGDFDIILSDYTIPGYCGLQALSYAREQCPAKPFIYFSGTINEEWAIEALKCGASDYIIKDRAGRLIPAIKAALSKAEEERARQQAEREIRQQASLLDKAREAISAVDSRGCVTYWNASAESLYGWKASEAVGRELRRLLYPHDSDLFDSTFRIVAQQGEWRGELPLALRNGGRVLVESFWSRVNDEHGRMESVLIVEADVTEARRLDRQLRHSQRIETLGLHMGGIAHDLKNVLAPILTSVEILRNSNLSQSDGELLASMEMSARHGIDLVQQLLAFSQGGKGIRTDVNIPAFIENVQSLLRTMMPPNIEIRSAPITGSVVACADATQLRQVLLNLCINARDAMPAGGIIRITAEKVQMGAAIKSSHGDARHGAYVRITVADSGTGIPQGILEKIFDPFFTTKRAGKGTGLGLVTVAEIVESHGGFLRVESELGAGTTFQVHLPAVTNEKGEA
jgi:two-component system, cell cycle sensor histidine kinase and response regulator CckA